MQLTPLAIAVMLLAQQPKLEFEVATIKPQDPVASQNGNARSAGGSATEWRAGNLPLRDLIRSAYNVNANQIAGTQPWMDNTGWDVVAKSPAGSTPEQFRQRLQTLLADRFQLVVHHETLTLPVYNLTVAKSGPKLEESTKDISRMSAGPRMINYSAGTMDQLVSQLTSSLGKQVIDKTGLTGHYHIDLKFTPVGPTPGALDTDNGPSIFTALQEQAGLKLDSTKSPVEVLVVDKAEKPSAN